MGLDRFTAPQRDHFPPCRARAPARRTRARQQASATRTRLDADDGRVRVRLDAPPGVDPRAWRDRIAARFAARRIAVDALEVE